MRLCKEYIDRLGLDVKMAEHVDFGIIFLRQVTDKVTWRILRFEWHQDSHHPGYYRFYLFEPSNDCFILNNVIRTWLVEWDDFENFLSKFDIKDYKPVFEEIEIVLTALEMFVHTCDTDFVKYMSVDGFEESLDVSLPSWERYKGYLKFEKNLSLFEDWKYYIMPMIQRYYYSGKNIFGSLSRENNGSF